jgi:hypothetical protein
LWRVLRTAWFRNPNEIARGFGSRWLYAIAKSVSMLSRMLEPDYVFRSRDGSLWIHLADGTERLATVRETIDYPTDDPEEKPPD